MDSSNLLVLAFILLFCILLTMKFSLAKHEILLGILVALLHFCSCMIEICCCFSSVNVNLFQLSEDFLAYRLLHPIVLIWIPCSYSFQLVNVICWFLEKQFQLLFPVRSTSRPIYRLHQKSLRCYCLSVLSCNINRSSNLFINMPFCTDHRQRKAIEAF